MNLASRGQVQSDMFAPVPRPRSAALGNFGQDHRKHGPRHRALGAPTGAGRLVDEARSPGYTCRWSELPRAH